MSTNGRVRDEEPNVATSFSGLAHDVIELGELQAQLFAHDVKSTTQQTRTSLLLAAVGTCLLLGSVPVVLFALAELFVERFEWSRSAGFAAAALVGVLASAGTLAAAWNKLSVGLNSMQRSRDEFNRNLASIKSSLRSQSAPRSDMKRTGTPDAPSHPR